MKLKGLLKFYFCADRLNAALDRKIMAVAMRSGECAMGGEEFADAIIEVIAVKGELSALWGCIDRVISSLDERDRQSLERYSKMRCGIRKLDGAAMRELHRAAMKFTRKSLPYRQKLEGGQKLVGAFAALL